MRHTEMFCNADNVILHGIQTECKTYLGWVSTALHCWDLASCLQSNQLYKQSYIMAHTIKMYFSHNLPLTNQTIVHYTYGTREPVGYMRSPIITVSTKSSDTFRNSSRLSAMKSYFTVISTCVVSSISRSFSLSHKLILHRNQTESNINTLNVKSLNALTPKKKKKR
jgi:hypothetical protein